MSIGDHKHPDRVKPILLAEDSPDDAELIRLTFQEAGVVNPITVVKDGLETIDYLVGNGCFGDREKYPLPCVLLLDLKMPVVDGFEVLEWFRDKHSLREALVIVLSGHREIWRVTRAYELGARSFLVKPCTVPEIINLALAFPRYFALRHAAVIAGPSTPIEIPSFPQITRMND